MVKSTFSYFITIYSIIEKLKIKHFINWYEFIIQILLIYSALLDMVVYINYLIIDFKRNLEFSFFNNWKWGSVSSRY